MLKLGTMIDFKSSKNVARGTEQSQCHYKGYRMDAAGYQGQKHHIWFGGGVAVKKIL